MLAGSGSGLSNNFSRLLSNSFSRVLIRLVGTEQGPVIRSHQSALEAGIAEQGDETLAQLGLVLGIGADTRAEALDGIALRDSDDTGGDVSDVASLAEDAADSLGHGGGGEAGDDDTVLDKHGLDWLFESSVGCCCRERSVIAVASSKS